MIPSTFTLSITMKKLLLFFIFSLHLLYATAQREYWGMTRYGGPDFLINAYGSGVIFKTNKNASKYEVVHNFDSATGFRPEGSLIQADNGKLYGFTGSGFTSWPTKLFELDPITKVYKVIMNADTVGGNQNVYRWGSPFVASNGKIYSLASNKLIETNPATGTNKVIASALSSSGGENYFMQASNGNIYFVTSNNNGIVGQFGGLFVLNPLNNTVSKLYQFVAGTGAAPYGSLVEWTPGILYGTFSYGSGPIVSQGGIFSFNLNTNTFEQKKLFFDVGITGGGSKAYGGLTRYGNKLYGALNSGGVNDYGLLYKYDPATNTLDTLVNFAYQSYPYTFATDTIHNKFIFNRGGWGIELISGYDGRLYGLTQGSMFSYDVATNHFYSLIAFYPDYGNNPSYARLLQTCTKPYFYFTIPDTVHVLQGMPLSFALGTPNTDTFRWYKNNNLLTAQADSTLHIDTAKLTDQGWYNCKMTNECGDSTTKKFYLKVDVVTPLPLVFTATANGAAAKLQWKDENAANISYYELQRSAEGGKFAALAKVNATYQITYNYNDEGFAAFATANVGKACYRLKQVAKDGIETYSQIVCLSAMAHSIFTITPNPARDKVTVNCGSRIKGNITFDWIAANGQVVQTNEYKNITTQTINISHLPTGVYTLRITTANSVENGQVVVER